MSMMKRPSAPPEFTPGPPILPSGPLLEWLDAEAKGSDRQVRLPVILRLDTTFGGGVEEAYIGSSADHRDEAVPIKIDDTRMGMSVATTLGGRAGLGGNWHAVWLDGHWAPSDDFSFSIAQEGDPETFSVLRVGDAVESDEPPTAFISSE